MTSKSSHGGKSPLLKKSKFDTRPVVTVEAMRRLDLETTRNRKISVLRLMENAGQRIAEYAEGLLANVRGSQICLLLGKGNNAGDALVAGRLLASKGARVRAGSWIPSRQWSKDMKSVKRKFAGLRVLQTTDSKFVTVLENADLVIDGLLGTGARGPLRGSLASLVERVDAMNRRVLAVDLPTGLDANLGLSIDGPVLRAKVTVALAAPKAGMLGPGALDVCGKIVVADIGIPQDLLDKCDVDIRWVTGKGLPLPQRFSEMHKGNAGRLSLVAGSSSLAGAGILAARAGSRSGAGLVRLLHPRGTTPWVASRLLGEIAVPIGNKMSEYFIDADCPAVIKDLEACNALAVGPGLGRKPQTQKMVLKMLKALDKLSIVLDADALVPYHDFPERLQNRAGETVLTPHPGEMSEFLGMTTKQVQSRRYEAVCKAAQNTGSVVVLKGALSLIADPHGLVFVNPTGNHGMAKGGSGDLLTGLIGGFMAQGLGALDAAVTGCYLHGLAGDLASERDHPRSAGPEQILDQIGHAFGRIDD